MSRNEHGRTPLHHAAAMNRPAMVRLLLALDRRQNFRRRVLRALEREPGAFDQMLAIHLGSASVRDVPLTQALRLGWKIMHA